MAGNPQFTLKLIPLILQLLNFSRSPPQCRLQISDPAQ